MQTFEVVLTLPAQKTFNWCNTLFYIDQLTIVPPALPFLNLKKNMPNYVIIYFVTNKGDFDTIIRKSIFKEFTVVDYRSWIFKELITKYIT